MKRSLLTSLTALGSLFLPARSLAGVDFQFPADGPMPKYFSGANNGASAKATVNGTTIGITRWELWLNDQKTAEADIPPGSTGLYVNEVAPEIIFTSTRFAPGTDISIVLKVWTTDGEVPVEAWSMPVPKQDVAAIFGRNEWESPPGAAMAGAHATRDLVADAKYDVSRFFVSAGWSSSDVAATLGECSLFYANTHASDDSFQADIADDYMWAMRDCGDPNVLDLRTSAIGTGLPPFNSTGKPPITIAFLDSCFAGSSPLFSNAFLYPWKNAFSNPQIENQAFVGWVFVTADFVARTCANAFWHALRNGSTVKYARLEMVKAYLLEHGFELDEDEYTDEFLDTFVKIYGDENSRLNSVYTADDRPQFPIVWWRQIQ